MHKQNEKFTIDADILKKKKKERNRNFGYGIYNEQKEMDRELQ